MGTGSGTQEDGTALCWRLTPSPSHTHASGWSQSETICSLAHVQRKAEEVGAPCEAAQALRVVGTHSCLFPSLTLVLGLSAKRLRHQVH